MKMKKLVFLFIGCLIVQGSVTVVANELTQAIKSGDFATVNALLQSGRFNNTINESVESYTILHFAVMYGTPAMVAALIAAGADVNQQDSNGLAALHLAALFGRQDNALILIVAGGAHVDQLDNNGSTPMHLAAAMGHLPVAQVLYNAKANVNLRDRWGDTPVDILIRKGFMR